MTGSSGDRRLCTKQLCALGRQALALVVEWIGQRSAAKLEVANRAVKASLVYMVSRGLFEGEKLRLQHLPTFKKLEGWFPVIGRNPDESNGRAGR